MNMRSAIQRSCDVYFYEVARLLGVDRLSETAKKFGLGKKVLDGLLKKDLVLFLAQIGKENSLEKIGIWRNITLWYRTRIFSKHTITTLFNDCSNC